MVKDVTVEEALALVLESCSPLPVAEEAAGRTVGRPLTADAVARRDLPPFDRALCAGYAARAADLSRANHKRPALLTVTGTVPAGAVASMTLSAGQAVRLEAGSPVPLGCDCVVPLEDTDGGREQVSVFCQLWPFDNIERAGSLVRRGEILCRAGQVPGPARSALLRCAGVASLPVRPGVRLGVLTVGDELADPGLGALPPAAIPDFDQLYLSERWGDKSDGSVSRRAPLNHDAILDCCKQLLSMGFPLLLTAGGQQLVFSTLLELGAQPLFQGVQLRRCAGAAALRYRSALILILPGDPFAAGVLSDLLVPAALAAFGEDSSLLPRRKKVRLVHAPQQARPQRRLLPAALQGDSALLLDDGQERLTALDGMTALVDLPAGARPDPGATVSAFLL